jgi:hypothetical protein
MDLTMMLLFHRYPRPAVDVLGPAPVPPHLAPSASHERAQVGDSTLDDGRAGAADGPRLPAAACRDEPGWDAAARAENGLGQGAFYVAAGLWPLVSLATFELVSGSKDDGWLGKSMRAFIAAIGGALVVGARSGARPPTSAMGMFAASTLAACDVYYVARGRIARTSLLDAVIELGLVAAWLRAAPAGAQRPHCPP